MLDLLANWEKDVFQVKLQELPAEKRTLDDKFAQSSFVLEGGVRVTFVKDIQGKEVAKHYSDLPELQLNEAEQAAVVANLVELSKKPSFFDGNQLLVTNVHYDPQSRVVYMEAKRAKYSVLATLSSKKFPANSLLYTTALYKTGVMTPFITADKQYTCFMERNDPGKLYSVASGFLEPVGDSGQLSFNAGEPDLVVRTAVSEAHDEFLVGENEALGLKYSVPHAEPQVTAVSFRKMDGGLGTVEFIAPMFLTKANREDLERLLKSNYAKDRKEHTGNYVMVTTAMSVQDLEAMNGKPGKFLYDPCLREVSRLVNKQQSSVVQASCQEK